MAGINDGLFDNKVMLPTLTDAERDLRDRFVAEYVIDRNEYKATMRLGYMSSVATSYSQIFMNCPYVQKRIAEQMYAPQPHLNKESAAAFAVNTLAQVMASGGYKERVSAAKVWADIHGLNAPTKTENKHMISGGVMLIPAIADIDAWEREAVNSQAQLVEDTRNG